MLGQVGVTLAFVTGADGACACSLQNDSVDDTLEEIHDALDDLNREVTDTVRDLTVLQNTDGIEAFIGTSDTDGSDSDPGFDSGPEFDGDPGFDSEPDFDGDPGFDSDPEFGEPTETAANVELDNIDDDIVINGVPVGEKESLADLNEAERERLEGTRINGVVIGEDLPIETDTTGRGPGTNESTQSPEAVNGNETTATPESGPTDAQTTPSSEALIQQRLDTVERSLDAVRDETERARETVDELETYGIDTLEREIGATRQLLTEIEPLVDRVEQNVPETLGTAIDTMETIAERIEDRMGAVEDAMDDSQGVELF